MYQEKAKATEKKAEKKSTKETGKNVEFTVESVAFQRFHEIPPRYTGVGEDVSPPLDWSNVPGETRSFTLICEDIDADAPEGGRFTHWVIYDISPEVTNLPEGIPNEVQVQLPVLAYQGRNSFGRIGYSGPLPPIGDQAHRYIFTIYALSKELSLQPGADKTEVLSAMAGWVLASANTSGRFKRV